MTLLGLSGFATVLLACLVWIAVLQGATMAVGHRIGRYNVVDVSWGLGFVGIAVIAAALGGGDPLRRILLAVLIGVWGLRLSRHMHVKSRGRGEDPRYVEYLGDAPSLPTVAGKVFGMQGASQLLVGAPVMVIAVVDEVPSWAVIPLIAGLAVALAGLVFEAVGDAQLRRFTADPANRGRIMDRGLWGWTRHPNYFGDACLWWGIWLITLTGWPALTVLISPVAMTYFLVHATGARRLERLMSRRPGYREYQQRTSFFVPRPPRRR